MVTKIIETIDEFETHDGSTYYLDLIDTGEFSISKDTEIIFYSTLYTEAADLFTAKRKEEAK